MPILYNMPPAIDIQQLGKQYQVRTTGSYLALRDVIAGAWKKRSRNEAFWALKDINLQIAAGERVGIIGRNGAGKSTLLKILSRVTYPTTGQAKIRGRLASLLEVGTGFHPELTGRENIFLNGAILGLKKSEIQRQFDAIVDFSGVEKFLDNPLKHFSSGMQLRLAFAVAAHLEPEVLLIDEVLAVGDLEFQRKCIGKMEEVSRQQGRTIVFVSHNLAALRQLTERTILLEKGQVILDGDTKQILSQYAALTNENSFGIAKIDGKGLEITNVSATYQSVTSENRDLIVESTLVSDRSFKEAVFFDFGIYNEEEIMVIHSRSRYLNKGFDLDKGEVTIRYSVRQPNLAPGAYFLTIFAYSETLDGQEILSWVERIPLITVDPLDAQTKENSVIEIKSVTNPRATIEEL